MIISKYFTNVSSYARTQPLRARYLQTWVCWSPATLDIPSEEQDESCHGSAVSITTNLPTAQLFCVHPELCYRWPE